MSAEDIKRGALTLGAYVLGSIAGLLGPRQNIQQVTNSVRNILTTSFSNEALTEINNRTELRNFNYNEQKYVADGNCVIDVRDFDQVINQVMAIQKFLTQEQYTQFVNRAMANFTNALQAQISRNGIGIDQIFERIATILGGGNVNEIRQAVENQFSVIVRNLYRANINTDTRVNIDSQNRIHVDCRGNSRVNITGSIQSIVQNTLVYERIRQIQQGFSTTEIVIAVNNQLRSTITTNPWLWWIIGAVVLLIVIIVIGLIVWGFSRSGSSSTAPQVVYVQEGGANGVSVA